MPTLERLYLEEKLERTSLLDLMRSVTALPIVLIQDCATGTANNHLMCCGESRRVWKSVAPQPYSGSGVAWIVDSGASNGLREELNVVGRKDCTQSGCPNDGDRDRAGHGTMIAGVIGAIGNSKGVIGVAPGVPINSLRVVSGSSGQFNLINLVYALSWLEGNATASNDNNNLTPSPGDVINISLGLPWSTTDANQDEFGGSLKRLADNRFKISIAAGNTDVLGDLGYVQAIFPAELGGYRATSGGGLIATASAMQRDESFWPLSAFGNFTAKGMDDSARVPDFVEPGADIVSLWPGPDLSRCSGTSLAAAFLSGILLWGAPTADGYAQFDPSAGKTDLGFKPRPDKPDDYDPTLLDKIGIKP